MSDGMARRRRARELERRLRELDHWDEVYGLGGLPPASASRSPRRRRGTGRRSGSGGWVLVLVLVAVAVLLPTQSLALLDRATDLLPGGGEEPVAWAAEVGAVVQEAAPLAGSPPVTAGSRVLREVPVTTSGAYRFLQTQPGSDEPVGFSPCERVEVVLNPEGAPEGYQELVEGSLERVSAATGVLLELAGESDDEVSDGRNPGDPVLIDWATEGEIPGLAGLTAGFGGPLVMTDRTSGRSWLASGSVALDLEGLPRADPVAAAAVLDHELAHVMGLGHVEDADELMAQTNTGQTGFGPGDLEGLARVGAIECR